MPDASSFSPDYVAARARLRAAALSLGAHVEAHGIDPLGPDGEALTLDAVRLGAPDAERVVLVTSGLHGIESDYGSAVQAALLEEAIGGWRPPPDGAVWLIHALNPWGMAWRRRVNEDNVDLNRNFLLPDQPWRGTPPGYAEVDRILNPSTPPSRFDPFLPRAAWVALRRGGTFLQATAAAGQYDRPRGLFFGGNGPSRTSVILREQLPRWTGSARSVLHLDLATGVGPRGRLLLLSRHPSDAPGHLRLVRAFGEEPVVPLPAEGSPVRGELLDWMAHHLPHLDYEGVVAKVGTVGPMRLLQALRAENRAFHHGEPEHPATVRAREGLEEALCPTDRRWRDRVVPLGVRLCQRALEVHLGATVSRRQAG
jgi:hypothetical protein